jgi:hypothetical protein
MELNVIEQVAEESSSIYLWLQPVFSYTRTISYLRYYTSNLIWFSPTI